MLKKHVDSAKLQMHVMTPRMYQCQDKLNEHNKICPPSSLPHRSMREHYEK